MELKDAAAMTAQDHRQQGYANLGSARLCLRNAARELDGQVGHHETLLAMAQVDDAREALEAEGVSEGHSTPAA